MDKAGKKTIFDLLEGEAFALEDILNSNYDLIGRLKNFFKKSYNIEIGYCAPGPLNQITRWYNAKLKLKQ